METSNWNPLQTLILDYTWPIMTRETFLRIFKSREIMIIFPTKIVCDCLLMMMMCARKYEISVGIWDKDLTKLNLNILFWWTVKILSTESFWGINLPLNEYLINIYRICHTNIKSAYLNLYAYKSWEGLHER